MARRRVVEPVRPQNAANGVPAELLVGRCTEVWADPTASWPSRSAARRWSDARNAWLAERGLATPDGHVDWHGVRAAYGDTLADHSPWSIQGLDDEGRSAYADSRLSRGGVTRSDVPALREAAMTSTNRRGRMEIR